MMSVLYVIGFLRYPSGNYRYNYINIITIILLASPTCFTRYPPAQRCDKSIFLHFFQIVSALLVIYICLQLYKELSNSRVEIAGQEIAWSTRVSNRGVVFDSRLSMGEQATTN